MEWSSSPPGSPEKNGNGNGNALKRKAEEAPRTQSKAANDMELELETEAPRAQEITVSSTRGEKTTPPQDGKSSSSLIPPSLFSNDSSPIFSSCPHAVLDLTDLPSSPSSPTFPPVAKRAKPGPSSSRRTTSSTKTKKSTMVDAAAGDGGEKNPKPKEKSRGKGKGKSDLVKSGSKFQPRSSTMAIFYGDGQYRQVASTNTPPGYVIVVVLNKKKKLLTLDQTDLAGVVSSYTPFMTCEHAIVLQA